MNTRDAFKANLPIFEVKIRGNACGDGEVFTSKTDRTYERFTLAYTSGKDKPTIFVKVMCETDEGATVSKGDYVEVEGDYSEQTNEFKGVEYLNRTVFTTAVNILGLASDNKPAPKASTPATKATNRKR